MPKQKADGKGAQHRGNNSVIKNRIGFRDSGKAANQMSTEDLLAASKRKGKDGAKALRELQKRGIATAA